jgi:hypothetical protein
MAIDPLASDGERAINEIPGSEKLEKLALDGVSRCEAFFGRLFPGQSHHSRTPIETHRSQFGTQKLKGVDRPLEKGNAKTLNRRKFLPFDRRICCLKLKGTMSLATMPEKCHFVIWRHAVSPSSIKGTRL